MTVITDHILDHGDFGITFKQLVWFSGLFELYIIENDSVELLYELNKNILDT